MITETLKRLRALVPLAIVFVFLSGCIAENQTAMSDRQLFQSVKVGMTRSDVEKLLGEPVLDLGNKVYYGKPPKIEKWQSPQSLASIVIVYSAQNIVQSKEFYGSKD